MLSWVLIWLFMSVIRSQIAFPKLRLTSSHRVSHLRSLVHRQSRRFMVLLVLNSPGQTTSFLITACSINMYFIKYMTQKPSDELISVKSSLKWLLKVLTPSPHDPSWKPLVSNYLSHTEVRYCRLNYWLGTRTQIQHWVIVSVLGISLFSFFK